MSKRINYLTFCIASALLIITTMPLRTWGAEENSSLTATAGSTQAAASGSTMTATAGSTQTTAEASASESSTDAAAPAEAAAFSYEHDPMDNPKAARDIMVNPDAVYGYSPRPDSVRLKEFADADWSDAALVESARQTRLAYHESMAALYRLIEQMLGEGKNVEEIARAVSTRRNELRLESYKDDPARLEKVKKSNLDTYGDESGPTPESLYEKYGSWQTVLEKALSSNPGMDACLGMYDQFYDLYEIEERSLQAGSETAETADNKEEAAADQAEATSDTAEATTDTAEAAAEQQEESADKAQIYKVVSGDSLWNIAQDQYGDGSKWNVIYEANKEVISDPGLIFPGQELTIPNAA